MLLDIIDTPSLPFPMYQISAGAIGIASTLVFFVSEKSNIGIQPGKVVKFTLLFIALIGVAGLSGFLFQLMNVSLPVIYIFNQLYFLGLGSFFTYYFYKNFSLKLKRLILSESLALLSTAALGFVVFSVLFDTFSGALKVLNLGIFYASSLFMFFLPFLYRETFFFFIKIPKPIYKIWKFPREYYEPDLEKIDLSKQILAEIEIHKSLKDTTSSNLKLKAPLEMNLSDWFFLSLQEYNFRQPENQIEVKNGEEDTFEWQFFVKPSFFSDRRFLDPDLNIRDNKIKENKIIIAERVLKS